QSRLLAARERRDGLEDPIAAEAEAAEEVAQLQLGRAHRRPPPVSAQVPDGRVRRYQWLELMLREVADTKIARLGALAAEWRELAGEELHQRGLAGAVAAEGAGGAGG